MTDLLDPIDRAMKDLWRRRTLRLGGRRMTIACLLRPADWRPLKADWWRGKEVSIIGADMEGNFFLRHCDGSIRHWDHRAQSDTVVARSVHDFVAAIAE
jgi:hypothetical protein